MFNVVLLAFAGEVVGSVLQQIAFVMQKLAHQDVEKK